SMDDRVVVAVMFNEYHDSDDQIIADIRQEVETIVPEKDVVIYTDDKYWDHMRDIIAGKDRSGVEQYIKRQVENFFKTEKKPFVSRQGFFVRSYRSDSAKFCKNMVTSRYR